MSSAQPLDSGKSKPAMKKPSARAELSLEALLDRALEEVVSQEMNSPEATSEASQPSQTIPLETDEQARAAASAAACSLIEETAKMSGVQLKDLLAGLGEDDMPAFKTAQLDAIASAVRPVAPRPRFSSDDLLQPLDAAEKRPAPAKISKVKSAEPPKVIQRPFEPTVEEPKVEQPKSDAEPECKAAETVESKVESVAETPAEPVIEQSTVVESTTDAAPLVADATPVVEQLDVEQSVAEETLVEAAAAEEPVAPKVEQIVEQLVEAPKQTVIPPQVEEEKDTFPQMPQQDAPKTWTNNDFPQHSAVTQLAEAGKFVMGDDKVSRTDLVHLLEGFVKILRTDSKSNLPAEVNYDLTANGGRYTDAIVDDRTQEIENMRKVIVEAQETIIKLLTDRVEDRAKIASLETQIKLLPDLQAQADRAMAVAIHTEDFRADLTKVKFELERYRLARVRAEADNRKSWVRKVWVWIHGKWTRTLAEKS